MSIMLLKHHRVECDLKTNNSCIVSEEFTGCSNIQQVRFQAHTSGWEFKDNKSICLVCSQITGNKSEDGK